jgi:hypothetical protein
MRAIPAAARPAAFAAAVGLVALLGACAGSGPAAQTPSDERSGATSRQAADNPDRKLTSSECESLGQWIAQVCADHPNTRSSQIDGWCGDMVRTVGDGTWVGECTEHVKYFDAVCFRSTTQIRALMDCDSNVSRP